MSMLSRFFAPSTSEDRINLMDFYSKNESQIKRRTAYIDECRRYEKGEHFTKSEIDKLSGDAFMVMNFCEDYVEKYSSFLFPKNPRTLVFEVNVKSLAPSAEQCAKEEGEIMAVYREQKFFSKILEQVQNFLIGGMASFAFYPDKSHTKFLIRSVDPRKVITAFRDGELVAVVFEQEFYDFEKGANVTERTFLGDKFVTIYHDKEQVDRWEHRLGMVPFAWIADREMPDTHDGRSMLKSIYTMDKQISETATHFGRRVADNTDAEMAVFSDVKIKKAIVSGRSKVHHLPKDSDIKYLEKKETNEPIAFCEYIEARIKNKLSIVESAGTTKAIVSGVSLATQYNDMMDAIARKRVPWDVAFRSINRAILSWKLAPGEYPTDPVYHSPIPLDVSSKIDDTIKLIDKKLISRADAISEIRAKDDPQEVLQQIADEDKKFPPVVDTAKLNESVLTKNKQSIK